MDYNLFYVLNPTPAIIQFTVGFLFCLNKKKRKLAAEEGIFRRFCYPHPFF